MENITSGHMTIDPIAVKDLSKEELYEICKGTIDHDFDELWIKICKANGNDADTGKLSKQGKKP